MTRSIRGRLQWWYGVVYTVSIIAFGCMVFWRFERDVRERAAQQVASALQYLDVSLRNLPPGWVWAEGERSGDRERNGAAGHERAARGGETLNRLPDRQPGNDDSERRPALGPLPPDFLFRSPRERGRDEDRRPEGNQRPDGGPVRRPGLPLPNPPVPAGLRDGRPGDGRPGDGRPGDGRPFRGEGPPRKASLPQLPEFDPAEQDAARNAPPAGSPMEFVVWRADGSVLASDGETLLTTLDAPPVLSTREATPVIRFVRDFVQGSMRGPHGTVITVLRSTVRDEEGLWGFAVGIILIGATTLVVGLAGGWWVSGRMVKPIERISRTASGISASRLDARIEVQDLDRELVQLGSVLNDAFSRLESSFLRLTQFTADASHELRTPLAVIQSQIELTLSQDRTTEVYQQTLETCLQSTQRLQSMVDGLLLLARADAERLDLARQPFDLRTVVEDACVQLQSRATEFGVELECITPEDPLMVAGDPAFLARVPFNLLDNAIRHTPAEGKVVVEVSRTADSALITVTDNGSGIAAEHLPHLFDRFYRVDVARSRSRGGSGLGLSICRSLIEAHGGSISCESKLGKGSVFTVRLPMADSADPSFQNFLRLHAGLRKGC